MNLDIANEWADVLESGAYKQTTGKLNDGVGMCCLGVLCDIYAKKGLNPQFQWGNLLGNRYLPDVNRGSMCFNYETATKEVMTWSGLQSPIGEFAEDLPEGSTNEVGEPQEQRVVSLASKNDNGSTFKDIAALIRKHATEL